MKEMAGDFPDPQVRAWTQMDLWCRPGSSIRTFRARASGGEWVSGNSICMSLRRGGASKCERTASPYGARIQNQNIGLTFSGRCDAHSAPAATSNSPTLRSSTARVDAVRRHCRTARGSDFSDIHDLNAYRSPMLLR